MFSKRKGTAVVAAVAAASVVLVGCSSGAEARAKDITVAVRAGGCVDVFTSLGKEFQAKTGVRVHVQEVNRDSYVQRITTELLGGSGSDDVVLLLNNLIPQFASGGQLESLDSYLTSGKLDMGRYLPATVKASDYKGKTYGIPYDVSALHLFYRKDLIPTPPKTLSEYRADAEKFTRSITPSSPTEFGTTFQGLPGDLPKEWYTELFAEGGQILNSSGKPVLNSKAAVDALTFAVDNANKYKIYPPDYTTYEFQGVDSAFQNGKTAMMVNWTNAATQLTPEIAPKVANKWATAIVPGGRPYMQVWEMGLNAASSNKQTAFDFMKYATTEGVAKHAMTPCFYSPVTSVLQDPKVVAEHPQARDLTESLKNAQTDPAEPAWPKAHEVLNTELSAALAQEKTPKQALDEANQQITKILGR